LEVLSSGKLEAHIEKRRGQDKFFLDFKEWSVVLFTRENHKKDLKKKILF
jgi:hypothetical protein